MSREKAKGEEEAKGEKGGGEERKGGSGGAAPRRPKKSGEAPVIAVRMEELLVWVMERCGKMPREHKFTVGDRLVETCLEVTVLLVEASYSREKQVLLQGASRALTRARVLARVAQRLRLLSGDQQRYFAEQSLEIGKMLGGWTRSLHPG